MTDTQTDSTIKSEVAQEASVEAFFGYLYLLPTEAKGLIVQTAPDFRMTAGMAPVDRNITTAWSRAFKHRKHTSSNLLISQLFRKKIVKTVPDVVIGCTCISCASVKEDSPIKSHHPACACFYCKIERSEDSRDFYLFGVDATRQDKLMTQPYRISNVYNDGKICFRKKEDYKVRIPLTLREANVTFWGSAFDPDFIQNQGHVPHTCLTRAHSYPREHAHLCRTAVGHKHSHSCDPEKTKSMLLSIEESGRKQQIVDSESFHLQSQKTALINRKEKLIKSKKGDAIHTGGTILYTGGGPLTESQEEELKTLVKEIATVSSDIASKLKISRELSANREQLRIEYQRIKERCHCCAGICLCARACPCCNGEPCECFKNCKCRCCTLACGCSCNCDLSEAFADFVAAYKPIDTRWEDYTLYFCGNAFYSSSKKVTAAFIGFKRDLGDKIPEEMYRTTPGYEKDPFVVGSAQLDPETDTWSLEIEQDIKLNSVPASQVRVVK